MYEVKYQPAAAAELNALRVFDRVGVLDAIEKNLKLAPMAVTGKKKLLELGDGEFIRQLRVGDYRVFYDVDEEESLVIVRHVRRKGTRTTGEIL